MGRRQPAGATTARQAPAHTAAAPRWPADGTVGAALAAAMFLACCIPLNDTDLFWHLKTGEWILEHAQAPYVDLYTFTNGDRPWIDLHWGFQVVFAAMYKLAGSAGLVTLKATVLAAAMLVGWFAVGRDAPPWLRAIPWCLALVTISGRGYERPEIFSLLFLATWLWLLERAEHRPQWLWWLPPLQVLWINMHALFVLGLVVGACRAADELVRTMARGRWGLPASRGTIGIRQGGYVAAACAAAALVNPYFEEGALFPLTLYRKFTVEQAFYAQNIGEFAQPLTMYRQLGLFNVYFQAEVALWCVAAASFLYLLVKGRQWNLYRLLLFAAFSHLAWEAVRNTSIFSMVAAAVTCGNWRDAWVAVSPARDPLPKFGRANALVVALLGVFCLAVVTDVWHRFAGEGKRFGFGERVAWFPHDAARFAGQPSFPEHAFAAHFGVASVYTYHNGPERKVFMDGRLEVCTQQTFELYNAILMSMEHGSTQWEALVRDRQGRLPVVLLDSRHSRPSIEGLLHQPHWRLVFADASCAVFLETVQAETLGLPTADYTPLLRPPR